MPGRSELKKQGSGAFKLEIPLDASGVEDFTSDQPVRVAVVDHQGVSQSKTVRWDAKGNGAVSFSFEGDPGRLRIVVGPELATAEELVNMQTIGVDLPANRWQGKAELKLTPIRIPAVYWHWWLIWCRTFVIRGRVLCPDGDPVPGATVCAYDVDAWWWWFSEELVGCATTDATGSFEIKFRWCCGWWPWYWLEHRVWRLEPTLADEIGRLLRGVLRQGIPPVPGPNPDLGIFQKLLATGAGGIAPIGRDITPERLDDLRQKLMERLPRNAELERLRLWPWWPWWPWWDCTPDIIFRATQTCAGQQQVIVQETIWNTRWNIPTTLDVILAAGPQACCITQCKNPRECPDGDCLVISDACGVLVNDIGGNPGAAAAPAGYANPGSGDQPFAGTISIDGQFGDLAGVDYYEFEWATSSGGPWNSMPAAAAGGFSRVFFGPPLGGSGPIGNYSVDFPLVSIGGHLVIESRQHFEANHDPSSWGFTRYWISNYDLLVNWLTENNFADGTYYLRVKSWSLTSGALTNNRILPLCDTGNNNGLVLTIDNRFVGAGPTDAYGNACGSGSIHICTTEPGTGFIAVRINGNPVDACTVIDAKGGGKLEIDFFAYDPDQHLSYYTLLATYGSNLAVDLLSVGGTLTPGPSIASVPSAAQVGPTYPSALLQGASSPNWAGGTITLTIPDLSKAFPETCCYQLELRAWKRTIVSCNTTHWNLSEFSFTVVV